jgi:catechol 2,3-dioxygenase-like lactoylglutathione lyase family enzyme
VTGIGGVFFRSQDPQKLQAWYEQHLGIEPDAAGYVVMRWGGEHEGSTVWALFPEDTEYFGPPSAAFMINYRVDDLNAMLDKLIVAGVKVDDIQHEDENGRFGWAWDPEGNRIELWEPAAGF